MKHSKSKLVWCLFALLLCPALVSAQSDAYDVLNKNIAASGGLEKLKAERSQYVEGTLAIAGLSGTMKIWTMKPNFSRNEVDLKVLRVTQGENADGQWVLDSNGKLQLITKRDEASLKRKDVKQRMAEYEFLDPKSTVFNVEAAGMDTANGVNCHVIKVSNTINADVLKNYINASTFLLERAVSSEGDESSDSYFGDYRDVRGLKVAHYTKQISILTGQVQEFSITKYESNPVIEVAFFDPPAETKKDYRFTNGSSAENTPFKFSGGHIYMPVTVNCKERYWVLDTGASMSVIGSKFAKELGLETMGNMKGGASNSTVDIQFATLPPFSVKGIEFDAQQIAVIDMEPLNKLINIQIDGILGFDFLSRFVTKVDYAHELLSFYDPKTFSYVGDGTKLDVHLKDGVFVTKAELDGVLSGTWLCDLGASGTSLEGAYAKRSGFLERSGVESMGRGAGDAFRTKRVMCDSIAFAGFTLKNPKIAFPIDKIDTVSAPDEIGNLGNTLFRNFVLYVDYANEQMIVEQGDKFGIEWPDDRSGLQLIRGDGDEIKVWFASPGTPSAKAGFQENDLIVSINDIPIGQFAGIEAIRNVLCAKAGTQYRVTVKRAGKELLLNLTLKELL